MDDKNTEEAAIMATKTAAAAEALTSLSGGLPLPAEEPDGCQKRKDRAAFLQSPLWQIVAGEADATTTTTTFTVHQAALQESPVMEAMMRHAWKETQERRVDMGDEDTAVVTMFVDFLYRGNYSSMVESYAMGEEVAPEALSRETRLNIQLYRLADYYQMPRLKHLALQKTRACEPTPADFLAIVEYGQQWLPPTDVDFRHWMLEYIGANWAALAASPRLLELAAGEGCFAGYVIAVLCAQLGFPEVLRKALPGPASEARMDAVMASVCPTTTTTTTTTPASAEQKTASGKPKRQRTAGQRANGKRTKVA
ncbi:hypothetical protein K490DRAFT_62421 [Saccharata proteae CBS 121410]|uniref:BTB domain-containing protein n=1 Tax=Saccharata proteae CBS 121410 TaxID=1314787 RepID=A0A9P4LZ84_9PEZI|nr:hypothetical protein K490DRAFT_62421 [Saccharata proteae CBS 121410]